MSRLSGAISGPTAATDRVGNNPTTKPTQGGPSMESLHICRFCRTDIDPMATVCPGCRATRRSTSGKWQHYREARRTDILVAGLALVVLLWLIGGVLITVLGVGRSSSSTFTPVTTSCPTYAKNYPFC